MRHPVAITLLDDGSIRIYGGWVTDDEGNRFQIRHVLPEPDNKQTLAGEQYAVLLDLASRYGKGVMDDQGFHPPMDAV